MVQLLSWFAGFWRNLRWAMLGLLLGIVLTLGFAWNLHAQWKNQYLQKAETFLINQERQYHQKARKTDEYYRKRIKSLEATVRNHPSASGGLYDHNTDGSGKASSTSGIAGTATEWRLSDTSSRFLREEARRADELKVWADTCYKWVQDVSDIKDVSKQ